MKAVIYEGRIPSCFDCLTVLQQQWPNERFLASPATDSVPTDDNWKIEVEYEGSLPADLIAKVHWFAVGFIQAHLNLNLSQL